MRMMTVMASVVGVSGTATADLVTWEVDAGGNGHSYESVIVSEGVTWTEARQMAEMRGGHLVTLTSQEESAFVYANLGSNPALWRQNFGPWIGAFQDLNSPDYSEPLGGWRWVTEESWAYTNWNVFEPNNGGFEHVAHMYNPLQSAPTDRWNDVTDQPTIVIAFLVEYGIDSGPNPACDADLDGSFVVDLTDLLLCLAAFGSSNIGDTDSDGDTDLSDLLAVLGAFGGTCN